MPETHPYYDGHPHNYVHNGNQLTGGIVPENSRLVIMGTFPPPEVMQRVLNGNPFFYYNSPRNHYWNRIESFVPLPKGLRYKWLKNAKETEAENVRRKIELAHKKCWAYMDFFSKIERRVPKSADDLNIIPKLNVLESGQLDALLTAMPSIGTICCTYKTSFEGLVGALKTVGVDCTIETSSLAANGKKYIWPYRGRSIEIILLFPASRSRHKRDIKNYQYQHFLA
jgi:G:T/U-mismatch repair DNA glycosylase